MNNDTYQLGHKAMARVWGDEWEALPQPQKDAVVIDFLDADCSASEYLARIYPGNLASYVRCLFVRSPDDIDAYIERLNTDWQADIIEIDPAEYRGNDYDEH